MSIKNNMRSSPKLLCEVLKSKNVVCTPNYNVINSYLLFLFSFFYDNVIAIRCTVHNIFLTTYQQMKSVTLSAQYT